MLVQSVILLFELKHFGRVPLFKRFCHLLFAALLDDSTEPGYFGRAARGPYLLSPSLSPLEISAPCGMWRSHGEKNNVVIKLLFVVTSE